MKKGDEYLFMVLVQRRDYFWDRGKRFDNVIEGITFREEVDEQSGLREVIIETKDRTRIPTIVVEGKRNNV